MTSQYEIISLIGITRVITLITGDYEKYSSHKYYVYKKNHLLLLLLWLYIKIHT